MWVEASDAVNVTHEGVDVATSLVELVVGCHLAEVASITDVAVWLAEGDLIHCITTDSICSTYNCEIAVDSTVAVVCETVEIIDTVVTRVHI